MSRFPKEAKIQAGHQLNRVQRGLMPDEFDAMPTVGAGVYEIKIDTGEAYRVFYVAKFEGSIFVLHAFNKKSTKGKKTSQRDIDIGSRRYLEAKRIAANSSRK